MNAWRRTPTTPKRKQPKRAEQARVTAQEKAKAQSATAELKDAADRQGEAAAQSADADSVEGLAKAEQQQRRESAARQD